MQSFKKTFLILLVATIPLSCSANVESPTVQECLRGGVVVLGLTVAGYSLTKFVMHKMARFIQLRVDETQQDFSTMPESKCTQLFERILKERSLDNDDVKLLFDFGAVLDDLKRLCWEPCKFDIQN